MPETFFIGCTHFDHANIIEYSKRPYASIKRMNEALVENWNDVVKPGDTVWMLGDFCWHSGNPEFHFRRLHGHKNLIVGNHDMKGVLALPWQRATYSFVGKIGQHFFHLCHYPLREWDGYWKGTVHLHAHVHGTLPDVTGSMDVSCERIGYQPISLSEIEKRFAEWRAQGGGRRAHDSSTTERKAP